MAGRVQTRAMFDSSQLPLDAVLPLDLPDSTVAGFRPTPSSNNATQAQKLRGGYYTPSIISRILAEWAIPDGHARVLEPSAGDGQLITAAVQRLDAAGRITAVELDAEEAAKVAVVGGTRTEVVTGDFFAWYLRHRPDAAFDAVIGNPPFIRCQHFPEKYRQVAFALMREERLNPNRLTNAWMPFVVLGTRALRPGGRLALVLPAELLQVNYASQLREYLARKYEHLTVVTFRQLVFDGILQETVLLLGVRRDVGSARISFVELDSLDDLSIEQVSNAGGVGATLDHAKEKWTQYYLSPSELDLIRDIEKSDLFLQLGQFADVDVGVVTGRNEFFVLTDSEASRLGVKPWCVPLIGRSAQIPGLVLSQDDWERLAAADGKCYLLRLGNLDRHILPASALAYVEAGERARYHEGYKCRIRLPRWWNVPSPWAPDAFLLRQIYDGPRIIENRAGATSTDTIHRIRMIDGTSASSLAAASMNSLTFAFAEIRGRSYGGGVLELEPTEAERLPFPKNVDSLPVDELNTWARSHGVEQTLAEVDSRTLRAAGMGEPDVVRLRGIWRKLYQRRMSRRRR